MANLRPEPQFIVKKSKAEVNYRQFSACRNCEHFMLSGNCMIVEGNISPEGLCDLWETLTRTPMYKDREFYEGEYNKSKK